jgi:predicted ATP-grasp superfamily ATP-dependent carboligase
VAHLRWSGRPTGERPVLIAAFEGWNDAGDAATSAVDHLARHWDATTFAEVDPEEFYDFTVTRPHIRLRDDVTRAVDWPRNSFRWALPEHTGGVVLLRGVEPQLKWRTFCAQVLEVADALDCSMVLTLGALLAEVAHSRPTPVFGNAYDHAVIGRLSLEPSRYEGPTGIVGVLHTECAQAGLDSASLWAAVPSYVPSAPSAKATLALVERATELIGATVPTMDLTLDAAAYEHEISQLVSEDDSTTEYVQHLEEQHDQNEMAVQSADDMVEEVERFLREQEK